MYFCKEFKTLNMGRLLSLLKGRCPKCEQGKVFASKGHLLLMKSPKMNSHCPNCSHKFMIETGYFFGAMFVSYALAVAQAIVVFLLMINVTSSAHMLVLSIAIVMILMSLVNFRFARMIWMYLFTKKALS